MKPRRPIPIAINILSIFLFGAHACLADPLPGTSPLTWSGDIASELAERADRFLLKELERSVERRAAHWHRDFSSPEAYHRSIEENRRRLRHILGVRDDRVPFDALERIATVDRDSLAGAGEGFSVHRVRWPAFGDVWAEGLYLKPGDSKSEVEISPKLQVIVIPDADQTPEQWVGLKEGIPLDSQFARRLAESGCEVMVPALIGREMRRRQSPYGGWGSELTDREYLYRPSFELGRHLIGYEIQKVLAAVDWFEKRGGHDARIGVFGYGEGGMIALYAGALDPRLDAAGVSGYFDSRQSIWKQPLDRNVFGLLEHFGDAELASMIAPRRIVIEASKGPELELPGKGGAPAMLESPAWPSVQKEVERARRLIGPMANEEPISLTHPADEEFGGAETLSRFLLALHPDANLRASNKPVRSLDQADEESKRQARMIHEIERHNERLLNESPYVRKKFMKRLSFDSLQAFEQSAEWYRDYFRREVVGEFDYPLAAFNARSRQVYDMERWTGYEVVLDVFEEVIAYGILCVPKNMQGAEKRPVVVCQHGLEGRPQDLVEGDHRAYHDFAAKLAERGYVTFAPQNLYIFKDRFRTLQRKANPLGKTLFSIIVPQHQQIVNWLKTLPFVDPERIAFYGLSYGGKTAMRVPPLVKDYCLSICSADFNDWVWKNASTRSPYSYVWSGEYEIFEFDLGSTFNYSEMAALIAPRPFMVERGHFDGVAPDERVAYEFAKVRHLYQAQLGLENRCEIEWFAGPHTIHGEGTFEFLDEHLNWGRD